MNDFAKTAQNPAPYDVLTARAALVEAAKLNLDAVALVEEANRIIHTGPDDGGEADEIFDDAFRRSRVALSLSTYALALVRWDG